MVVLMLKKLWVNRVLSVASALLLVLLSSQSRAEVVEDLYSGLVPVADRSAAALQQAARDALEQVLVKVSGTSELLEDEGIQEALADARSQVQQYAYAREQDLLGRDRVRIEFDDAYVTRLVANAGAALWTANRPLVLVWLVMEDGADRYFVNPETEPELSKQLLAEFNRRGVPVRLPLFDLADTASLDTADAWQLRGAPVLAASERYGVEHVLAGRVALLSAGTATGDWSYWFGEDRSDRAVSSDDATQFMRDGVDLVAESLARRYAVALSGTASGSLAMSVTGVNSYADYATIIAWLESLELIDHANVEAINGDSLDLRLMTRADAAQLGKVIELEPRLQPLATVVGAAPLSYQWAN